ncbi:MAG: YifB family Mg chelatase-like AAA ATPase [Patescibacteria group bacterium]
MFFKLNSAAVMGLDCLPVEVEVDITKGQTAFNIVGLADTSILEAKDRIHSALKNSGFDYPFNFRILINLAPADLHKEGPSYDLPMAVGIILISNEFQVDLNDALLVGELALDGNLRHTGGILPLALFAKQKGLKRLFVPAFDAPEAALVEGLTIYPVKNLKQLIDHLLGTLIIEPFVCPENWNERADPQYELDMALVKGQEFVKRALEIAASGSHNILMSGPPGSGKTLLARTLPSILPRLTTDEALEVTKIYSVAGLLQQNFIRERPFRSPHHTISGVALVGGGKFPRPGEISLSHRGVLFLDEFPEFPRTVLEALRQPLEDGVITISRAQGTLTFPARFVLVASQNPCPCGFASDPERPCTCAPSQVARYKKKISGPLLDRIDLHVEVPRVKFEKLSANDLAEPSVKIRERVEAARAIQNKRFKNLPIQTNSEMRNAEIREFCKLDGPTLDLLRAAVAQMHLSARGYNRLLKLARTIADLSQIEDIKLEHVAEALQYRAKME